MASGRLKSVDLLRVAAIAAVIAVHVMPFESRPDALVGTAWNLATVVNQLARFGVPCFFVLSGYFWAGKFADRRELWPPTLKMARRVLFLFVAWSAIYIVAVNPLLGFGHVTMRMRSNLESALAHPLVTLTEGTAIHLWFLATLLCCLLLAAAFIRRGWTVLLVVLAVVLYVTGLLGKAYIGSPLGLHVDFDFRHGPFFGLLFFVTGYLLHRRGARREWLVPGLVLAAMGLALQLFEVDAIHRLWNTTMMQDYVVGTYLFGVGVSMVALAVPGTRVPPVIAALGPLTLGAYVSHILFVKLLWPIDAAANGQPVVDLLHYLTVFILAFATSYLLGRWRWTRPLVT